MRKVSIIVTIVIGLIALLIGFVISFFLQKLDSFAFDTNIKISSVIINIISLLGTFFIAIYVTRVLSPKSESEKRGRDLLIDYLDNFEKSTSVIIRDMLNRGVFYQDESYEIFKRIDCKLELIRDSLESKGIKKSELDDSVNKLWDLFTGDPKENKEDLVRLELLNLEHIIYKLSIAINKQ